MPTSPNTPGRRIVVRGPIGSGKTTHVLELLQTYRNAGLTVAGVVSLHLNANAPERESYRFRFLSTGEERTFARRSADPTPPSSRYRFDAEVFAAAREELRRWMGFTGDVVVTVRARLVDKFVDAFDVSEVGAAGAVEIIRLSGRGARKASGR